MEAAFFFFQIAWKPNFKIWILFFYLVDFGGAVSLYNPHGDFRYRPYQ